jgi:hypothetical protein
MKKKFFLFVILLLLFSFSVNALWMIPSPPPGIGGGNVTNINSSSPYIYISSLLGVYTIFFNETYLNLTIDDKVAGAGSFSYSDFFDQGLNTTSNVTFANINITENLQVIGNVTIEGTISTSCLHCDGNNTYFHGDGYFEGNVTAPNIEVMESLIVHGNSSCTGTALDCNDAIFIGNPLLCGLTIYSGQRGCRWQFSTGTCIGTATSCADMSTSTCEEQHNCVLTIGTAGFIIDGTGLVGNFSINTTGNITANYVSATNFVGNGSLLFDVNETDPIWTDDKPYYVPYIGATDTVNLNSKDLLLNGTIKFDERTGIVQLLRMNHTGGDGFAMEYWYDFELANDDWLVLHKTDGNDVSPDGGIAFMMSNATHNWSILKLDGYKIANFTDYNIVTTANVTAGGINLTQGIGSTYIDGRGYIISSDGEAGFFSGDEQRYIGFDTSGNVYEDVMITCYNSSSGTCRFNENILVDNNITGEFIFGNLTQGTGVCLSNGTNCVGGVETDPIFIANNASIYVAINNSHLTYLNVTELTYSANLTNGTLWGYVAGNSICNQTFTGTRMCTEFDVTYYVGTNSDFTKFAGNDTWVIAGGPKYIPASVPVSDCNSFKNNDTTSSLGNYFHFDTDGGNPRAINCATQLKLACCR